MGRRVVGFGIAAIVASLMPALAMAQAAGVYAGSNSAGRPVSVTVSADQATQQLSITGAYLSYVARCKHSSIVLNAADEGPFNTPIAGGLANYVSESPYGYVSYSLQFSADGKTATGQLTVIHSVVDTSSPTRLQARYCIDANDTVNLVLQ